MGAYEWVTLAVVIATLIVNTLAAGAAVLTLWVAVRPAKGRHTRKALRERRALEE